MAPPPKALNNASKITSANVATTNTTGVVTRRGLITRQQSAISTIIPLQKQTVSTRDTTRGKRKAEASPLKDKLANKRSALGNITNAIGKKISAQIDDAKKVTKKTVTQPLKNVTQNSTLKNLDRILSRAESHVYRLQLQRQPISTRTSKSSVTLTSVSATEKTDKGETEVKKEDEKTEIPVKKVNTRRSLELEKSNDSSLYVSALESLPEENVKRSSRSLTKELAKKALAPEIQIEIQFGTPSEEVPTGRINCNLPPKRSLPTGVEWDFDVENWSDVYQVSNYAADIFNYLKNRERLFPIDNYMERQVYLTKWMRSLLVDWMVAVQESFELNHETLYLAVKLVDLYLTKVQVGKETLQLLGAASLFIASKYDERIPPMVEDFLYICDGAYSHRELTKMEISVLKVMDFDLGIPISYRFLRRYARCAKVSMPTLTLARYILEFSLMDYSTIFYSDSKMASAALFLALQMKDLGGWTTTLEYYTGYQAIDFKDIAIALNEGLHKKHKEALSTVRNKYSHNIFFGVAKTALKESDTLTF